MTRDPVQFSRQLSDVNLESVVYIVDARMPCDRQDTAVITADALAVEGDVSSMRSWLQRDVRHEEMSRTECRDAV